MYGYIANIKKSYCFFVAIFHAIPCFSATYYVDASRPDDSGIATSWATAKQTIQAAVNLTSVGDTVLVTNGYYALSAQISITNPIVLRSTGNTAATVINGQRATRCIYLNTSAVVDGFTITRGFNASDGAGVYCDAAGLITNCAIVDNLSHSNGGGVYLNKGGALEDCVLKDNLASVLGGGVMINNIGTLSHCVLVSNEVVASASGGGGAYCLNGGVINKCTFIGNYAENGGGVYLRYGGTCNDCLLIKNRASFAGGARYWEGGTLNSCTLSGNWSRYYGGAIHFKDGGNINNSIVWGNTCRDNKGNDIYTYGKSTKRYTCASDGVTQGPDGCFTSNPLFVAAANDDFHLQPNSPCINAGNNTYVFSENDLDDNQRIIAGIVDMGAFEVFTSYRISTTNNMHGSITPESPWVMQGKDQTFVIQPDPGYQLTALTLDGVPVAPVLLYTVTNVQSAQTVCTTFSKITYYVDASRPDDSGDGKSWITAKKTIQAAIDLAADAETVLVTNGVYNVGGTVAPGASVTNRVCITKPIAVESVNGPAVTVIEGAAGSSYPNDVDSVRGVFMTNGCSLIGFTVTKGHAMQSGNFYFDMCGGGIWLTENCVASNCVLTENYATGHGYGGGAYLYQGGSLIHCWLSKNWAYWNGGGAELYQAGSLQNCVLFNNTVYNRGGAVSFSSGGIIKNCTLVENYANEAGGGIYLAYGGTVQNSILWNNSAYFVPDEQNISNYGGELYNSCSSDNVTDGTYACFTNDPLFIEETNGNYQLRYGSPCINAGNNAYAPSDLCDLVGQPRIMGGLIDIGAFEYNSDYTDSNHDGIPDQWYISHALNCTNADTGLGDPDHDGQTTHDEYIAGTDPIAWWSCFKIQSLAHASSNHIHWNSVSGRVYSVYWTTNLLTGFELLKDNLRWPTDTFTNTTHTAKACFYKLKVKLE